MNQFLVIGASGYIGRTIINLINLKTPIMGTHCNSKTKNDSIRFNFFHDDISNKVLVDDLETVIFAAMVEDRIGSDVEKAMIRFAKAVSNTRLVYLSSDAVFSGKKGDYSEEDVPDSKSVYGRNLIICENVIRKYCSNHCIIRPSYLFGFSGGKLDKRLSTTKESLLSGQKVYLFCDMYKSPLGAQQFAEAALKLSMSDYIGTIHIAGNRTSVFDFHNKAMEALGVETNNLQPTQLPKYSDLPKDTSLDITKWKRMAKMEPVSIKETLDRRQ